MSTKNREKINKFNENGKRHGWWEEYWPSGKLHGRGEFVDGLEHGWWELYLAGKLRYRGEFVDGLKHGRWEIYEKGEFNEI